MPVEIDMFNWLYSTHRTDTWIQCVVLQEKSGQRQVYSGCNWRASETLTGVTQLKIGDVCLFICLDVRMSFCTLTVSYFCVISLFDPVPNFTKRNPLV